MDLTTVKREAMEGNKPSEATVQQTISRIGSDETLEAVTVVAEVGRHHPAYLAEFAEELGEIESVEDGFHLEQLISGVSDAIDADPSTFRHVNELLQDAIISGEDRTLPSVFRAIETAAGAGETVSDPLIQAAALRIATSMGGPAVQTGGSMFEQLVKAEGVNNTEAFDLVVGLIETSRKDIVLRFGNVLVDLILQKEVPEGADIAAAIRVLEEFKRDLNVPSVDVQSALNILES